MSDPVSVRIRMYNVGFGDCFLLRFRYGGRKQDKHMLIDFGSTKQPEGSSGLLNRLANQIKIACGGKLDVLVATHRHRDHIRGFETNSKGTKSGNIIASLKPDLVIQPWTEAPRIARDAKGPSTASAQFAFSQMIENFSLISKEAVEISHSLKALGSSEDRITEQLGFIGEMGIANRSAVENLIEMGKDKSHYVHFGYGAHEKDLVKLLPGLKITFLGPPTLDETEAIGERHKPTKEDVWNLSGQFGFSEWSDLAFGIGDNSKDPKNAQNETNDNDSLLFPDADYYGKESGEPKEPLWARWFVRHAKQLRGNNLLRIVRELDKHLNNTSVIMLMEVGPFKLLFPGDAEDAAWEFALSQDGVAKKLADVDVYKVGHHGSSNATPEGLWRTFKKVRKTNTRKRMHSLLSTISGLHGDKANKSEVPRAPLVTALNSKTNCAATNLLEEGTDCFDVEIDLASNQITQLGAVLSGSELDTWLQNPTRVNKATRKKR